MDEINGPKISQNNPGFVTKSVETPILDSDLRNQIGNSSFQSGGGEKGFFQANKYYFVAIIVGVAIISTLAYFAFRAPATVAPKEANVSINVEVPETIASGGEAVYKVTVQNSDSQKLVGMELELAYPDGAAYESSSPTAENLSGTMFTIPDLISGQNATVFIKTKVAGNINDTKTLNLKLHYKYSNFNSEFTKSQVSTIKLIASDVVVELQGPANTNNAQLVIYTVKYLNNSSNDISNARIKMTYPDGFVFGSSTPPPDLGTDTWSISALPKGADGNIQIQGTFNAAVNSGQSKTATADFLILGQDGQYFTQNSSTFTTAISSLPLLVTQELNGVNGSSGVINPGDGLNFTVHYQNNGSTVATGVNIVLSLDTKVVDTSSIQAEGAQINNSTITWNAASVSQLGSLAPNEKGQLTFYLRVNNPATKDSSKNLSIVSNIKIKSNEYDTFFPGSPLTLKVSSPSTISKSLAYVSGQLPPKVGNDTVYKVHLALTNSSNDFNSGILTAFIPLGAGGLDIASFTPSEAKNAQYDPSTGKLTWNVGSLPANTGRFTAPKFLEFQVKLNPSASQAGQSPILVKTINFTATDLYTNQNINITANDIRISDIPTANGGYGNGQVQQ